MPTNVTAEYAAAELEYQKAGTIEEKVECLKKMLSLVPKHKGTESLRAELKTKLAKLKEKLAKEIKQKKRKGFSLAIKKEGAAQVVLVGPPNSGKSWLLNRLTRTKVLEAPYPFSTQKPEVGIMDYFGVRIQIIEIPALLPDYAEKKPERFSLIRNADLVILLLNQLEDLAWLVNELKKSHLILNKSRPAIKIKKGGNKGLEFIGPQFIKGNLEEIKQFLISQGINNALIEIKGEVDLEDFSQILNESLVYLPSLAILRNNHKNFNYQGFEIISSDDLSLLKEKIWQKLGLIRVHTKEIGKKATMNEPVVLKQGSLIRDLAEKIHKDFIRRFLYAKVWGQSVKFPGQKVGLEHQLSDNDLVNCI